MIRKKFKDLTEDEEFDICDSVKGVCHECPIGKKVKCCNREVCSKEDLEEEIEYDEVHA